MQKLSPETLKEMDWRDRIVCYGFGGYRIGQIYDKIICFLPEFLKREILTLANLITLYGLFTLGESISAMYAWFWDVTPTWTYSVILWFMGGEMPAIAVAFYLLLESFVTDFFDGPIARLNGRVSALGTLLDHFRDYKAAFSAFAFLVAVTISAKDHRMLILELLALLCLIGILIYHMKLLWIRYKNAEFTSLDLKDGFKKHFCFFRDFALNEYQTELSGRIHFFITAFGVCSGIFYYFNTHFVFDIIFATSLGLCLIVSGWYLNSAFSVYCDKFYRIMQEKSDRLKKKVTDKTIEMREKVAERKEITRLWWIPNVLTITRGLLGIVIIFTAAAHPFLSFFIFFVAALTDFEGKLAKRWGVESKLGAMADPIADKILYLGTLLGLGSAGYPWILFLITAPPESLLALRFVSVVRKRLSREGRASRIGQFKTLAFHFPAGLALLLGYSWNIKLLIEFGFWLGVGGSLMSFASLGSQLWPPLSINRRLK